MYNKSMSTTKRQVFRPPLAIFLSLFLAGCCAVLISPAYAAEPVTADTILEAVVGESITLQVVTDGSSDSDAEIVNDAAYLRLRPDPGTTDTKSLAVRAFTNSSAGLTVTMSAPDRASDAAPDPNRLIGINNASYIAPIASADGVETLTYYQSSDETDTFKYGTWGVKLVDSDSDDVVNDERYFALPLSSTDGGTPKTIGLSDAQGIVRPVLSVAVYASDETIAGTYMGRILFTAVGNIQPSDDTDDDDDSDDTNNTNDNTNGTNDENSGDAQNG